MNGCPFPTSTHKRLQNYKKRIIRCLFMIVFYLQISIFYKTGCHHGRSKLYWFLSLWRYALPMFEAAERAVTSKTGTEC